MLSLPLVTSMSTQLLQTQKLLKKEEKSFKLNVKPPLSTKKLKLQLNPLVNSSKASPRNGLIASKTVNR